MLGKYNILDFETTGLSSEYDRVIEVGVIKVFEGRVLDQFQTFVDPGQRISSTITSITGITNQMLLGAPSADTVMPRLKGFVGNELIVAHNAAFDSRFFFSEMNRAGIKVKNQFLCSLLLSRRVFPELVSHKLSSLCDHLGFVNRSSHRALEDAEVTQLVFEEICSEVQKIGNKKNIEPELLGRLCKIPKKKVNEWLRNQ